MDAIILSGGFGTRLRPLTFSCPKPIIPFCNVPILEHQIAALAKCGVKRLFLAISKNPIYDGQLLNFSCEMRKKYDIEISLSIETSPLGTGGPIGKLSDKIVSNDFFVLNGDVTCSYPLRELFEFHKASKAEGTILTTKVKEPSKYGVVLSKGNGEVYAFVEKPKDFVGDDINAGIYCFKKEILNRLEERQISIEKETFPAMAKESKLFSFELDKNKDFWMDIGQPKDYLRGTEIYLKFHNVTNRISKSSKISKTASIGDSVVIGENCIVEDNVKLSNVVVFSGTIIKNGSFVSDSIIGWNCVIEENSKIKNNCVLEKDVKVSKGVELNDNIICSHRRIASSLKTGQIVL